MCGLVCRVQDWKERVFELKIELATRMVKVWLLDQKITSAFGAMSGVFCEVHRSSVEDDSYNIISSLVVIYSEAYASIHSSSM